MPFPHAGEWYISKVNKFSSQHCSIFNKKRLQVTLQPLLIHQAEILTLISHSTNYLLGRDCSGLYQQE